MGYIEEQNRQTELTGLEIAVIGMAGSFPGAVNIDEFWENLKNGVESLAFYTVQQLEQAGVSQELINDPNYVKAGGGILENKKQFDAAFFGYTPLEASLMDPQLRKLHECVWSALENAGYDTESYDGLIGLYAGASANFYWEALTFMSGKRDELGEFAASQLTGREFFATSIAYKLNLKGPGYNVLTACSTSLAAIHLACQSLLNGECHIALAGGVSILAQEPRGYFFQEGMINSSDGHCRAFDAKANGTVSGEGVGIVVLKTFEDALADRDYIHAIIKGTAVNNDGMRKGTYAAPSIMGQAEVIRAALQVANVKPESIGFIEAHGTGTALGDPIEIEALNMAFNTPEKNFCAIGSVKTNIGHLDAAAGVAGFIKTVLALKHGLIPPSLHFEFPNPKINFKSSPFYVPNSLKEWKNNPRRAGVSSFGIGGTNVHVVLERYNKKEPEALPLKKESFDYLFLLSAKTQDALEKQTGNLRQYLEENPEINPADAAYTLQVGRRAFKYRRIFIGDCSNPIETTFQDSIVETKDRPIIFMFPGQGSQYINMGQKLYYSLPFFRAEIDRCFEIAKSLLNFDIKEIIYPSDQSEGSEQSDRINQTDITQPLLFIFEYALAKLLMHWGIKPQAMIGHSIGEYVAAHLAGVFSLEDALKLVTRRGELMQQIPTGSMLGVPLSETELQTILNENQDISIAAVNTPSQCVLSGPNETIRRFANELQKKGRDTRLLHTSHAFHSPMMEPVMSVFKKDFDRIEVKRPNIPYISNVSGTWITVEEATNPEYWTSHLRDTVRFSEGAGELLKLENAIFIETGPGKTLSTFITQHPVKAENHRVVNLVRHPQEQVSDQKYLLEKLGTLWLYGKAIDWYKYHSHEQRYRIPLPTYPFEQKTYWLELEGDPLQWKSTLKETIPTDDIMDTAGLALKSSYVVPGDGTEKMLVQVWQDFFGIKNIGVTDDFFQLGGDSLKATALIAKIHKIFNVLLPLKEVFNAPTVRGLAGYIKKAEQVKYESLEAVEKREYYELSPAQKRLYILYCLAEDSTGYNLPEVGILEGEIDEAKFARVFSKLINRHESLRTSFHMVSGEPVQRVHNEVKFDIENHHSSFIVHHFIRAFDLSNAPLLRVGLFKIEEKKHILIIDMHHIISDGTSLGIFKKEFMAFYEDRELPALKLQYKDYSAWQNRLIKSGGMNAQETYWLKQFKGEVPVLNLPYDYPRPAIQGYEGSNIHFEIDEMETAALNRMAAGEKITLFMLLLALFDILLSRLSGMGDIVVGVPVAGRGHPEVGQIIGMFVNTLALRNEPGGGKTFHDFLAEVKKSTLEAFENQDYPFEDLVDKVGVSRDISRNPLFDVMFTWQNVESPIVEIPGLRLLPYNYENKTVQFDFVLQAVEAEKKLYMKFEYNLELFAAGTIERFIYYFKQILSGVLADPVTRISGIEIMSEEERCRLLFDFNDTAVEYLRDKTIHQLFKEQVEKSPDRISLVGADLCVCPDRNNRNVLLTYHELNEQSDQLAGSLIEKGVLADSIVGIMMERSIDMVIGIMGILKSGGAYMPIDPHYPQERIDYMLRDSNAKILIGRAEARKSGRAEKNFASDSSSLAYIIYTSGSTGLPKGTAVEHASVVNLLFAMQGKYPLLEEDVYLLKTSYMFDVSVTELFGWFFKGGKLVVLEKEGEKDPGAILAAIGRRYITHINFIPSMFNAFVDVIGDGNIKQLHSLKYIFLAGEALLAGAVEKFRRYGLAVQLENIYGPTEAAVYSAWYSLAGWKSGAIPIGKPLPNVGILVLDRVGKLQPVGVPGELYITGIGLARGYLNNPELTAEKFIKNRSYRTNRTYILYCTGDLARWLPDGNIEFLGRMDRQVKIRGYRIELGEIEDKLTGFQGICQAMVLAKEKEPGSQELVAYIVSKNQLTVHMIKEYLEKHLPGYMMPSYFHFLEQMPLLPNGKIDCKTLETYDIKLSLEIDLVPPENDVQKTIAGIWGDVLKVENIGIYHNFFDVGGNSLKIIQVNARLKETFKKDIAVTALFEHTTIHSQAMFIQSGMMQEHPTDLELDRTEEINQGKTRLAQRMRRREISDE